MKWVVTGAGGFLGAAVTAAAIRAGHEVVAVSRRRDPQRLLALGGAPSQVVLDVANTAELRPLFRRERPDVIVHSAWRGLAHTDRDRADQVGQVATFCRLVEEAADAGVGKVIGIGSQAEYGPLTARADETHLPAPTSLYGAAKLAASILGGRLAAQTGLGFTWFRLFAVYGPGDNPHWLIPSVITKLSRGQHPRLTPGTQKVDYLYIDDAADAVLAAGEAADADGIFNLASGQAVTVREIIEQLRDLAAPHLALVFGEIEHGPGQSPHLEGAIERLSDATGWRPATTLARGLALTVDAMRAIA